MRTLAVTIVLSLAAWVVVAAARVGDGAPAPPSPVAGSPERTDRDTRPADREAARPVKVPTAAALRDAGAFAAGREGSVSFAVVNSEGRLRGRAASRLYPAASTVKAMLLLAEAERLERADAPLDPATATLLEAMITVSDNGAADAVWSRVGDEGMFAIARRAGMSGFTESGSWGNAQVGAADLALLFASLDPLAAGPHREYALGLLGSIAPEQSWGIPAAARPEWAVRFKGGWLPDRGLVHQAAELRDPEHRIAIAVLTDAQPSFEYGTETVRGIAARLLGGLSGSGGG